MTYVREQTSAELAAHMRSLQAMPGWFDPLADRLWQEVQSLQRDLAFQKEVTDAAREQQAELLERAAGLRQAIATVCEGWTLPSDVRKILETALWAQAAIAKDKA